jgi:hypothetical protein
MDYHCKALFETPCILKMKEKLQDGEREGRKKGKDRNIKLKHE